MASTAAPSILSALAVLILGTGSATSLTACHRSSATPPPPTLTRADAEVVQPESDLARLEDAFADLRAQGFGAFHRLGVDTSDGFYELEHDKGLTKGVFYHAQDERAFDRRNNIAHTLYLHWVGDAERICTALRNHRFPCTAPPIDKAIEIRPTLAGDPSQLRDDACREGVKRFMAEIGAHDADAILENLKLYAARYRTWLVQHDPSLVAALDEDVRIVEHENLYELHVLWFSDALREPRERE
jgi:hypothetical protein